MRTILKKLNKYGSVMTINIKNEFAYKEAILYRSFFLVVIIYILIQLWHGAYGDNQNLGMTYTQIMWYLVLTQTLTMGKPNPPISEDVKNGDISYSLNKPYSYLAYHLFHGIGQSWLQIVMNFCVGSLLVYVLVGPLSFDWMHLLPVLVTIGLAYLLDYFLIVLINLLAFIMEDVNGVKFIYQKILFIIGGTLIPLDFFPEWLKRIIDNLPFGYIIYAPAKLMVDYNWAFFLSTVLHQAVWALAIGSLAVFVYGRAVRNLTVNGG